MATEIKLPQLGENLPGGDVLDIKVKPGDTVTEGQTLIEVEAEKSTVEVPSPSAGRIQQMFVRKGDSIKVGQAIASLAEASAPAPEGPTPAPAPKGDGKRAETAKARPREVQPSAGDGEGVERAKAPASPQNKMAAQQVEKERPPSQADLRANLHEGQPAPKTEARQPRAPSDLRPNLGEGQPAPETEIEQPAQPEKPTAEKRLVPAGPATRRLARELGVDLAQVHGSAPGGRVSEEDVKGFVRGLASAEAPRAPTHALALPDFSRWGQIERRPLDGVRRKTAEHVSLAWSLIPHVTQHDIADITDLEAFRKEQEGRGPKLTVTAFALKAAAIALRQFPQFNASLDLQNNQLIVKRYCHIGVAVDTERGLLVPVLRDVDRKSVHELAEELPATAERARQKKLQPDEMRGGSFTITNLGGIGGTGFSPIINYPEVAILGLSRSRWQPVVRDGQVIPRFMLPLSLSYDHRVIDGADAARFSRRIAEMLERPLVMLLDA